MHSTQDTLTEDLDSNRLPYIRVHPAKKTLCSLLLVFATNIKHSHSCPQGKETQLAWSVRSSTCTSCVSYWWRQLYSYQNVTQFWNIEWACSVYQSVREGFHNIEQWIIHDCHTWGMFMSVPGLRLSLTLAVADSGFSTARRRSTSVKLCPHTHAHIGSHTWMYTCYGIGSLLPVYTCLKCYCYLCNTHTRIHTKASTKETPHSGHVISLHITTSTHNKYMCEFP